MEIAIIICITFLMYYRTIGYQFIIDDHDHIKDPKDITKNFFKRWWEYFWGVKIVSFKVAHFFNILVHATVCSLIYIVFGKNDISFLTAVLFALNPVNNQASIWLSGRTYATSTALFLAGMC